MQQTAVCSAFVECVADRLQLERRPLTLGGMLESILAAPWAPVVLGVLCKLEPGQSFASDSGDTLRALCSHRRQDDAAPGGIVKLQVFGGGARLATAVIAPPAPAPRAAPTPSASVTSRIAPVGERKK